MRRDRGAGVGIRGTGNWGSSFLLGGDVEAVNGRGFESYCMLCRGGGIDAGVLFVKVYGQSGFGVCGGVRRRLGAGRDHAGVICVLAFLVMLSSGVCASGAEGVVGVVTVPHPLTVLLRSEAVYRELGLGAEQLEAVNAAVDGVDAQLWRLRDRRSKENDEKAMLLLGQLDERLTAILATRQHDRLRQLVFQAEGLGGVLAEGVARRLRLARRQEERIGVRVSRMQDEVAALGRAVLKPDERVAAMRKLQARTDRDILGVLDDWQRRQIVVETGRAFDLSKVLNRACRAPELKGVTEWINSGPVTLEGMRGQVVIVHFYTYGCINCVRNLPHYNLWQERFGGRGVRIVGIHRPEGQGEYDIEKVKAKAREAGIEYAVAVDNESVNWDAWANNVWPSVYAIDKEGFVRYWWYGELNWGDAEGERWFRERIEELLKEG